MGVSSINRNRDTGVSQNLGYLLWGGPNNKDYIGVCILGFLRETIIPGAI